MEEITGEEAEPVARVAALDVGKAELVCCMRVPLLRPRRTVRAHGAALSVKMSLRLMHQAALRYSTACAQLAEQRIRFRPTLSRSIRRTLVADNRDCYRNWPE